MFKIVDCERLVDGKSRLVVETDDPSGFILLSQIDSVIGFAESFRYQSKIAFQIKDRQSTRDVREIAAAADRVMILDLFETTQGPTVRARWNSILQQLQSAGRTWMRLDGVISILKIARDERKGSTKKNTLAIAGVLIDSNIQSADGMHKKSA